MTLTRPAEPLAADTGMGAVTLLVADLDGMTAYYRDAVRLTLLAQEDASPTHPARTILGRGQNSIIILEHSAGLQHAASHEAGLFHTAIVFETEADLAASVYSVASKHPGSFTGSADHLVSKAFYFTDPEGNGVELYWDRDRTEWSWTHGTIEMATLQLDPNEFLRENLAPDAIGNAATNSTTNMPDEPAKVGHVHLAVGDIATASEFYVQQLGFETTVQLGSHALFVSAGGYHHHMAMNTWNSAGAGRRKRTLGLGQVRIEVPSIDDLGLLTERLKHFQVPIGNDGQSLEFTDPWNNQIHVSTADFHQLPARQP